MRSSPPALLILLLAAAPARAALGDEAWKAYTAGDFAKAKSLCQAPAEAGDARCQTVLGHLHLNGGGVAKDHRQAERWFRKAAEQGDLHGQNGLALLYQHGWGVKQDYAEAARLLQKVAGLGEPYAEAGLGWLFVDGRGVKQDYSEAMKWFGKAADQGNPNGEHGVGWLHYKGWGVKKDYAETAKWWRRAAEQGHADCQQGLAMLYQNGWGVEKDYAEAFRWYKKSADQGNHFGENGLACLYFFGWGVKQDDAEAARLWRLAVDGDNPYSFNGLGYLHRTGRGVAKDWAQALKLFQRGIGLGDLTYCPVNLGLMYENGEGVTQDYVEALKWYLVGAAHDGPGAREGMEHLKTLMTKEQIAEAQKLAAALESANHGQAPASAAAPPAPSPVFSSSVDAPSYKRAEKPNDFALVVGIESYSGKDLPKADFAERDADAVAEHLRALGVPSRNLRVLKGSDATAGKLRGNIESWLPKNAKPDSRVYFYFSGHGAPNPQTGDAHLLPWDGDPALLKETAMPLKDLYAGLGRLKAAEVVVALDACFSGAGGRSVIQKGTRPLVAVAAPPVLPARLSVLAAAEGDQTTGTLESEGHGLFTYYLLEGLSRGHKTSTALCEYLKPRVADAAARENRTQTPNCRGADSAF